MNYVSMKYQIITLLAFLTALTGCVSPTQVHPHYSKELCVEFSNKDIDFGAYGQWLKAGLNSAEGLFESAKRGSTYVTESQYLKLCQSLVEREGLDLRASGFNSDRAERNLIETNQLLEDIESVLPDTVQKLSDLRGLICSDALSYEANVLAGYEAARLALIARERGILALPKAYRDDAIKHFERALEISKIRNATADYKAVLELEQAIRALQKV
jgi:tetratricopeptide (TPR) repeat protein